MKFGLCLPNFPFGVRPSRQAIVEVAQEAERLGFDSIWATDHILVPKDKPRFGDLFESLTTLAYLGGATEKIQLGTSVLVLPYRNAIIVAKQAATIDVMTEGRVILAVGVGWIEQEYEYLGKDFHRRGRLLDEGMIVMRRLWTEDDPQIDGEFYRFSNAMFEPHPVRPEGIPIWVGGNSEAAQARAARLGDAWHADDLRPDQIAAGAEQIRSMSNGRKVGLTVRRTIDLRPAMAAAAGTREPTPWPGANPAALTGSVETVAAELQALEELGLDHFICQFEHTTQAEHIEQMRFLAREFFPRFHS